MDTQNIKAARTKKAQTIIHNLQLKNFSLTQIADAGNFHKSQITRIKSGQHGVSEGTLLRLEKLEKVLISGSDS